MTTVESVSYKEAMSRAIDIDKGLRAYDFDNMYVRVEHDDGSRFMFNWAFFMEEGEWYYVFTEHHGVHVFHKDDVTIEQMKVLNAGIPKADTEDLEDEQGLHEAV